MAQTPVLKVNLLEEIEKREIKDPRVERTRKYSLPEIMLAAFVAILNGAESWNDIEVRALAKLHILRQFLPYTNGIPSHDTFNRFFQLIAPKELEKLFKAFVSFISQGNISDEAIQICIDGKTCRGASPSSESTVHMVSAWCPLLQVSLGQLKVGHKTNEITTVPLLLELLDLKGTEVCADSMSTQVNIVQVITKKGGDYILGLKDNQKTLLNEAKTIASNYAPDYICTEADACKGYHIERKCEVFKVTPSRIPSSQKWAKLRSIIKITTIRTHKKSKEVTESSLYYIASSRENAEYYSRRIKSYWSIERDQHWQLDVTFSEDTSRKRAKHAAENFSRLLRLVLSCVNQVQIPIPVVQKASLKSRAFFISDRVELLSQIFGEPRYPQSNVN